LAASPDSALAAAPGVDAGCVFTCFGAFFFAFDDWSKAYARLTSVVKDEAGAFWPVIGFGIAFQSSKLSATAVLGRRCVASPPLRAALVALVGVLMVLNSIGVYGSLSRAHLEHALAGALSVASRAAEVEAGLGVQAGLLADIDRRLSQIDSAIEQTTAHGRGKAATVLAGQQRKNRADLVAARQQEASRLGELQVQKAAVDGDRKAVEADLGPVRYLATLLGRTDEQTMRWFILVVALLLDPAAVLLLLAATAQGASMTTGGRGMGP
jgi:hypothetical protein